MSARILLVSSNHAAVYVWHGKQLHGPIEFAADEAGYAALTRQLEQDAGLVTSLLVDVIEEEFRSERVPHVAGRDQAGLLKRRLEQAYRLTPYRMGYIQNKLVDGKREDEALLSAITNVELIAQKLKLSRLSPAPSVNPETHADQLLAEVDKSQRYLTRLKLLGRDDMLVVHCISTGAELAALRETCRDTTTLQFRFHELGELHAGLRSGTELATPQFCDALFIQLLKRHTPLRDYATPVERRYDAYRRVRNGLHAASAVLVSTALAWTGMNLIDARLMQEFNSNAGRISGDIQQRYNSVMEELPKTPVSPQNLRTGVELAQSLLEQSTLPQPMLYALSAGLHDFPQVDVQSIEWVATNDPASVTFGSTAVAAVVPTPPPGDAQAANALYQVAQVKGSLRAFDGDYRKAFEQVNRLIASLKQNVELEQVRAVELPLNTDPSVLLQGKTGTQELSHTAAFILQAVLKVKHEIR
ncbi:MAG: hypothetical protein HY273_09590 [Gammaproteobacteria bacterium]|nr:hypothetical protein [Gammaproteobacteria bacterium]